MRRAPRVLAGDRIHGAGSESGAGGAGVPAEGLGAGQCRLPERAKQVVFCVEGSGEPLKAPEQGSGLLRFECLKRLLWPVIGEQVRCRQEGKSSWQPAQGAARTELAAAAAAVGRGRGIQASRTGGLGEGAQHPADSWLGGAVEEVPAGGAGAQRDEQVCGGW